MDSLVGKRVRVKDELDGILGVTIGDEGTVTRGGGILRVQMDKGWETLLWPDEVEVLDAEEAHHE